MSKTEEPRAEGSSAAAPLDRPSMPEAVVEGFDLGPEELEQLRQEFEESLVKLEARGPLTFEFGPKTWGELWSYDTAKDEGSGIEATGTVEVPTYTQLTYWEVAHPDPEVMARIPFEHIELVDVIGGSDELLAAMAGHRDVTSLSVHFQVTQADVDAQFADHAQMVEEIEREQAEAEATGEGMFGDLPPEPLHRVGGSPLTDEGVRALSGHPNVRILRLLGTSVSDEALAEVVATLPQLESLEIESDNLTGAFMQALGGTGVIRLTVKSPRLDGAEVNKAASLATLESLQLAHNDICAGLDASSLAKAYPNVTALYLGEGEQGIGASDEVLPFVLAFPNASVNGMEMTPRAIAKWAAKRGLTVPESA